MKKKTKKSKVKTETKFAIFAFSEMRMNYGRKDFYAPTLHPPQDTEEDARKYGRDHIKLDELKTGKKAFEVRPVLVPVAA